MKPTEKITISNPLVTCSPTFPTYVRWKQKQTATYGDTSELKAGVFYRVITATEEAGSTYYYIEEIVTGKLLRQAFDSRNFELISGFVGVSSQYPRLGERFSFDKLTTRGRGSRQITSMVIAIEPVSENVVNVLTAHSVHTIFILRDKKSK